MRIFEHHPDGYPNARRPWHRPFSETSQEKPGLELILLSCLLSYLLLAYFQSDLIPPAGASVVASLLLITITMLGCGRLLRADPMAVWSSLFWLRAAYAVYYGFGALVPYIGSHATIAYMQSLYLFSDDDVLKVNVINVAALLCILLGSRLAALHLQSYPSVLRRQDQTGSLGLFTAIFLIAGAIARYGLVLPFLLGFGEGFVPSIFNTMARAYSAGLMLLVIAALRKGGPLLPIAATLISIELFVGVLLFNKSDVLVTILCVLLAFYHHRPSMARLGVGGAAAIVIFASLVPIVAYGREQTSQLGSGRQVATLNDRLEILTSYLQGDFRQRAGTDEAQGPLLRLSYVNAAAMVVAWYDMGRPGDSLQNALVVIVPRLLWPDKPEISATGTALYTAATGHEGTSISPTIPAEAYWNFGWVGIPLLMLPIGVVLALLSRAAKKMMGEERFIFLPVVLMSIQMGTRVDGHYVLDFIGGSVTIGIMYVVLKGLEASLFSRKGTA